MRRHLVYAAIVLTGFARHTAAAQGVQAIRNSAQADQRPTGPAISRDSALVLLSGYAAGLALLEQLDPVRSDPDLRSATADLRQRVEDALAARGDATRFAAAFRDVQYGTVRLRAVFAAKRASVSAAAAFANDSARKVAALRTEQFAQSENSLSAASAQILSGGVGTPAASILVPSVVFTVGPTYDLPMKSSTAFAGTQRGVTAIAVSTNLLGAAAGSAFSGLGADKFGSYLTDNISVGTAVPTSGATRISADLSLGLGGATIGRWLTLWPVIQIQQLDSADARIPVRAALGNVDSHQWSVPSFAIAFVFGTEETIKKRLESGQLVVIPIVGIQTPYYYPGDSFTALAALFTSRRSSFVRAGPSRLSLGFAIPLLKVGGEPASGQTKP